MNCIKMFMFPWSIPELSHPLQDAPTSIVTDPSAEGIGVYLKQHYGISWNPLSFFSRGLATAEKKQTVQEVNDFAMPRMALIGDILLHALTAKTLAFVRTDLFLPDLFSFGLSHAPQMAFRLIPAAL
ncbi:unnamed protein product [Lepeophtheirus salmonis]|uniref:(salmon louse) hypothetical protein n=1 Tax=Lepeophtheirus salmonis TaxID=72036 RepID=A0A7R8CBK2_LEPSM|nr:unnamed protein product [Lepeophtheirus salmonis]CAF2761491.1 unnamed protein product [Lepeophtheirus salmonis]